MNSLAPSAAVEDLERQVRQAQERSAEADELLLRFGLSEFRSGQRDAVEAALAGRDCLVVMPTGGGKSLCYQLPALAGDGLVVVVSPLIALMADQLRRLEAAGVPAQMLASTMEDGHNARALQEIRDGSTRLVLVAPERFGSLAFRSALERRSVALFAVDEAHCIAEWGHDFRPDYLRLQRVILELRGRDGARPPVMAATATATPQVAEEIAQRLGLREWVSIRSGFDRPNLAFDVAAIDGRGTVARKWALLRQVLARDEALPAIVYCGTRRDCETVAEGLRQEGRLALPYHAGMGPEARAASQQAFMAGELEVMVATNAFGMGVDKADVRSVVHWALPSSLEAYYQEAGRAGRDGRPARALLLSARMDLGRLVRFIKEREASVEDVRDFVGSLRAQCQPDGTVAIEEGLDERRRMLLSIAERCGAVELAPGGPRGLIVRPTGAGNVAKARQAIAAARERSWRSYRSIERYGLADAGCRRAQILEHFGDRQRSEPAWRCCDSCDPDPRLELAVREGAASAASRSGSSAGLMVRGARGRRRQAAGADGASIKRPALDAAQERKLGELRAWRMERAGGKPAYTVTTDAVLVAVIEQRPASLAELAEIRGVGPAFCEHHGESLLELVSAEAG